MDKPSTGIANATKKAEKSGISISKVDIKKDKQSTNKIPKNLGIGTGITNAEKIDKPGTITDTKDLSTNKADIEVNKFGIDIGKADIKKVNKLDTNIATEDPSIGNDLLRHSIER